MAVETEENKIVQTVTLLATVGVVFVIVLMVAIFLLDRGGQDDPVVETTEGAVNVEEVGVENASQLLFESKSYGIKLNYTGEVIAIDEVTKESGDIIDCRKLSDQLRKEQVELGNVCFRVRFVLSDGQYIVVKTGDAAYSDLKETSIVNQQGETLEPSTKINLPLVRHDIDAFPTNFNGTKVTYEGEADYVFYKGVVYKGADKYAITIKGEIDENVLTVLQELQLD